MCSIRTTGVKTVKNKEHNRRWRHPENRKPLHFGVTSRNRTGRKRSPKVSDRQKKIAESRTATTTNSQVRSHPSANGSTAGAGVGECTLITAYVVGARSEKDPRLVWY